MLITCALHRLCDHRTYNSITTVFTAQGSAVYNQTMYEDHVAAKDRADIVQEGIPGALTSTAWTLANCSYMFTPKGPKGVPFCHINEGRAGNGTWVAGVQFNATVPLPSDPTGKTMADYWTIVPENIANARDDYYLIPPYDSAAPDKYQRVALIRLYRFNYKARRDSAQSTVLDLGALLFSAMVAVFFIPAFCFALPHDR